MAVRCPLCDVPLREVNRRGVQVDVCPECRGVWLDRGELDRLLAAEERYWDDRDDAGYGERYEARPEGRRDDRYEERREAPRGPERARPYEPRHEEHHYPPHKKKKGFLKELLDFDFGD